MKKKVNDSATPVLKAYIAPSLLMNSRPYVAPVSEIINYRASHVFATSGFGGNGDDWKDDDDEELDFSGKKQDWDFEDDVFSNKSKTVSSKSHNSYKLDK